MIRSVVLRATAVSAVLLCLVLQRPAAVAATATESNEHRSSVRSEHRSLADTRMSWPTREQLKQVVLLRDYNTRVVALGTMLLGVCGGAVGTFMLLRKRSLVGDVVSHASLPGVATAFLVMELVRPNSGKSLPVLLAGALVAGALGVVCVVGVRKLTRIKEDAAMAIVLSLFFGFGIALFTIVQNIPTGAAAGLPHFIFGKTASMTAADVKLIAGASLVVLVACGLLMKEFSLLCFDEDYAAVQGWPVTALDLALMGLVVGVTVTGLQSVGLLLVVATLIIPAAAARFWTDRLERMTLIAAGLGGLGALWGAFASALFPNLATGPVIVLVGSLLFVVSLFCGTRRGVLVRAWTHWQLRRRVGRHDLLRAFYECLEPKLKSNSKPDLSGLTGHTVPFDRLLEKRSWSAKRVEHLLRAARRDNLVTGRFPDELRLTEEGARYAARVARNHRLWEMFLIKYADVAPSHVDRDADQIEHVLEPELIRELDGLLAQRYPELTVPPSPHRLD